MSRKYKRFVLISIETVSIPELCPANENKPTYVPFTRKERNRIHHIIGPYHLLASLQILKHIVHSRVMKHLSQYWELTGYQNGFRAKRSTETQLIFTIHDIASAIQSNKTTHAVILDFSKAFDKAPHRRLLMKLEYFGIRGSLLNWFKSFLKQRTQSVVIEGAASAPLVMTSSVPQGTVLGPLPFSIYINELT